MLRGECKACRKPISVRYPLVEALGGLLAAYAIWRFGLTWKGGAACVFLWMLIALTFIDFDTQLLPDNLTLPLLWAGLIANVFGLVRAAAGRRARRDRRLPALWIVYWLFKLIRGKEGMGYGDFKLLAALGAWLGWQMLPLIILLSSVVGAVIGISLMVFKGRDHSIPLAFGPYLAIAGGDRALLRSAADQGLVFVTRPRVRSYLVGLTGGIGSGKSEVAAAFAALGRRRPRRRRHRARDQPARRGRPSRRRRVARRSVRRRRRRRSTARHCAAAHSTIRRFAAISNQLLHPLIARATRRRDRATSRGPYGVLVVPLLLERGGLRKRVARVLVVDCPEARADAPRSVAQRTCRRRCAQDHGDPAAARRPAGGCR